MTNDKENGIFDQLSDLLKSKGIDFRVLTHAPAYTSAQSAAARGVSLHAGAKALVVKANDNFLMIVVPADFSLDNKATKRELHAKSFRFANEPEVFSLTSLKPGAIPPFGSLFNLQTFCDRRLEDNETIYFNAGSHSRSIAMGFADYLTVEHPSLGFFGKAQPIQEG
ncbi:MAG TPA: YbaK/EbsC family protein [Pyrinomonadaceae bacterium]|nr:YbaK/EbsC family protein [Pyrinomonadaceae bacterium]